MYNNIQRENEKTNCPLPSLDDHFFDAPHGRKRYARVAIVNPPPQLSRPTTKIGKTYIYKTNITSVRLCVCV